MEGVLPLGRGLEESLLSGAQLRQREGFAVRSQSSQLKQQSFNHSLRQYKQESKIREAAHPLFHFLPWKCIPVRIRQIRVDVRLVLLMRKPLRNNQLYGP